jgi:hypothetical protein
MFKIFKTILIIVWIIDILNFKCVQCLDTTYPVNTLAWFLIWILIIGFKITITKSEE